MVKYIQWVSIVAIMCSQLLFGDATVLPPFTTVQEKDVKSFITMGMDQQIVKKQFGTPYSADAEKNGEEVWEYRLDPKKVRDSNSTYAGFEIFFKYNKIFYLGIIRSSIRE